MARFRGTVRGGRGEAHRLGHATTGLTARASGWNGSIQVELWVNHDNGGEDWARVWHHTNAGSTVIYNGPLDRYVDPRGRELPIDEK